jgi:hypothetical protein
MFLCVDAIMAMRTYGRLEDAVFCELKAVEALVMLIKF